MDFVTTAPVIEPLSPRRKRLSDAMDRVRDRHGEHALVSGRLFGIGQDDAPDRIGFRKL